MQDPVVGKRESCFTMDRYENETSCHIPKGSMPSSLPTLVLFCLALKGSRPNFLFPTAYSPDLHVFSQLEYRNHCSTACRNLRKVI